MKKSIFIKGKISGLIELFYIKFEKTVFIQLPEKKRIIIHTDGTIHISKKVKMSSIII